MSNLLVVGDHGEIGPTLLEKLKATGHEVIQCATPSETFALIEKNQKFDLIISYLKLPEMNVLDFYTQLKAKNRHIRFLLISEPQFEDVEQAYDLGIDEVLATPLNYDMLNLVINYFFESQDAFGRSDENYFSVPIEDLIVSSHSDYSIYLKINNKYICVTKTGHDFTAERLNNIKAKNIKFIYLNSGDYSKYTDLQFALSNSLKLRPLEAIKKTKAYNHLISTVSQNAFVNKIDKTTLDKSLKAFENYTHMAFNNNQLRSLLESFVSETPGLAERSSALATISSSVALLWQWNSPRIQSRIVLGALLCDVGLKECEHLVHKPRSELTKEELIEFEQHPLRSYKILSEIDGLPHEILQIALQHHENGLGQGFPQKLIRSKLHSFSKLVNGSNEFLDTLYSQSDKTNTKAALDKLFTHQRKLMSEQVLKSLYKLFDHTVPRELDGLLLPDESARVF